MRLAAILVALALELALATASPAWAQSRQRSPDQVPINELIDQLQQTSPDADSMDLVWWMPPAFWSVALAQSTDVPEDAKREIDELFGKYVVVGVVKGTMGNFGVDGFLGEAALRQDLRLVAPDGTRYEPVPADALDPRFDVVIGVLKPLFGNVLGELGKNLNFFAFPGQREDGHRVVDPLDKGRMTVMLAGQDYVFQLPLAALLVPAVDPATGAAFPGDYRFNPYTGAPLQAAPGE